MSLYAVAVLLVLGLVWIFGLAGAINTVGAVAANNTNISAIDRFFYSNINLLMGFFYLIAWLVVVRT